MNGLDFQKRIGFDGDIVPVLEKVCLDFNLGDYISHKVVPVGYEDFNIILTTSSDKYFLKLLAKFRDESECRRYIDIMDKAIQAGVNHPKLIEYKNDYLYKTTVDKTEIRLCVMEFVDGTSFYEGKLKATPEEMLFLVHQAAIINKIDLRPKQVYDSWAIIHFLEEYEKKKQYLVESDTLLIDSLVKDFSDIDIKKLPHCFVHGDIIKTNVIKDKNGKLYILDFSVSSYYPRIQELAVLLCNMLFDEDNPDTFAQYYDLAINEYRKNCSLDIAEINALPTFVRVAHAMHVICATYEKKANGNNTLENEYWIDLGKKGLGYTVKHWKTN